MTALLRQLLELHTWRAFDVSNDGRVLAGPAIRDRRKVVGTFEPLRTRKCAESLPSITGRPTSGEPDGSRRELTARDGRGRHEGRAWLPDSGSVVLSFSAPGVPADVQLLDASQRRSHTRACPVC